MLQDPARITFRFAQADDAECMKYLYMATRQRAKKQDEHPTLMHFEMKDENLENSADEVLLATQNGRMIGYIAYQSNVDDTAVKVTEICTLQNDETATILFSKLCKMKSNAVCVYMTPSEEMKETCEELFLKPDVDGTFVASEKTLTTLRTHHRLAA